MINQLGDNIFLLTFYFIRSTGEGHFETQHHAYGESNDGYGLAKLSWFY